MRIEDFRADMFTEGVPTYVFGGRFYRGEKIMELKPLEGGLGKVTNQIIILNENQGYINKAIIGGIDNNGNNFLKEFVYVGTQSFPVEKAGKKEIPQEELKEFKKYIEKTNWRDAKTYAQFSPHQYVISHPCMKLRAEGRCLHNCEQCKKDREEFEHWVMFIRQYGEHVVYGRNNYVCLRVDDKHYWSGGDVLETTWVLNRAITNDPRYKVPMRWVERGE